MVVKTGSDFVDDMRINALDFAVGNVFVGRKRSIGHNDKFFLRTLSATGKDTYGSCQ